MGYILRYVGDGQGTNTPINHYEADTQADMWRIDTSHVIMGSRCYVINNGNGVGAYYALDGNGNWYLLPNSSGSSPIPPGSDIIYEGGDLDAM